MQPVLDQQKHLLDTGELTPRTFAVYLQACVKLAGAFGKNRLVTDLTADDFQRLRAQLAEGRSLMTLRNDVRDICSVFKFSYDDGLIESPARYGSGFKIPSKSDLRKARHKKQQANSKRMFAAAELRTILNALDGKQVTFAAVNEKTGKPQKVKLRPKPKDADDAGLVPDCSRGRFTALVEQCRNTLVKTCRLKPGQTEIFSSSLSSRKCMSCTGAYGVREKGGLFCCPAFDEFREQNRTYIRVCDLDQFRC